MGEKDDNYEGQAHKKIKGEKKGSGGESIERKKKKKPAAAEAAEVGGGGGGGGKEEEDGLTTTIVLKLDLHCDDCAQKIRRFIKNYNGVEQVKGDSAGGILTVKGNVDPNWLRVKVEKKTQNKVELVLPISHQPNKEGGGSDGGGGGGGGGGGDKKADDKTDKKKSDDKSKAKKPDDKVKKKIADEVKQDKTQEKVKHKKHEEMNKDDRNMPKQALGGTAVLKIPLHCDDCAQKIKRIMKKIDGIDKVSIDNEKDLVTLEGMLDMTELIPYVKDRLKRKVDIVSLNINENSSGGEKKGKETAGEDYKEKTAPCGGGDKNEKTGGGNKEKKEKADGGGDDYKKGKANGSGGEKKEKESNGSEGGGNEKVGEGGGGGGCGSGVGEKHVDDSKRGEDKGKAKIEEPKVEVSKMEYQGYGTPYTYFGVPFPNHSYANQGYDLSTIHNSGYHASTSYVVEYNDPCHHHLHNLHQPQIPPPPLTYLPPPHDHLLSNENPDTCFVM